jgi:biopolymer transport protein ExbD
MMRFRWIVLVLIAFSLTACNKKEELKCEIPDVNSINSETSNKSDNLNVSIYVDGSGSMLGYVKDGETNYIKALKSLRNVFELTGKLPV